MTIRNEANPDGVLLSAGARPVRDNGGAITGAIAVFKDITRVREAERLGRLVPVCSWCRKIRSDEGYWHQLEEYIQETRGAQVTHGVCPSCEAALAGAQPDSSSESEA